ncbi:unnamed protein product, partial [Ixodes pacificus]
LLQPHQGHPAPGILPGRVPRRGRPALGFLLQGHTVPGLRVPGCAGTVPRGSLGCRDVSWRSPGCRDVPWNYNLIHRRL